MNMYESLSELCLDLDYDDVTDLEITPEGEYELLIRNVSILDVLRKINESFYYKKLVRKRTPKSIAMVEKQFITGQWNWVLIRFEDSDLGVNCIASIASVPYYSELGDNINVESREIADALRREELIEIID